MTEALVRMYNVGFGDAFLVRLPAGDGEVTVLFDCGSHASSPRHRSMDEVVGQIIDDVREKDGTPRIDVVVGTHRHKDHVSGFDDERWSEVAVGEVWLPWTEDPEDAEATRIRERQSATARRLAAALAAEGDAPELLELAENQLTNADAMKTLRSGFAGSPRRRFLAAGDDVSDSPLARVGVQVLGPSRDERVIRDMDPPTGEAYLRMIGLPVPGDGHDEAPFADEWMYEERDFALSRRWEHLRLSGNDKKRVHAVAADDRLAVTVALDKAVNGTSLVIAFDLGDAVLLFPADAQWGTWDAILSDPPRRELVARTTFLKVGHHGSHNATPRDFVELLAQHAGERAAMVSTHTMPRWPAIPKPELLDALEHVTPRVARSDRGADPAVAGFEHWSEDFIDCRIPLRGG